MHATNPRRRALALIGAIVVLAILSCDFSPSPTPRIVVHTIEVPVTQLVPVTSTPEPTPFPTPTPPIILQEDFESGPADWFVATDASGSSAVEDGKLLVTITEPNWTWYTGNRALDFLNSPFDLSVTLTHEDGPRESYGAVSFRYFDPDNNAQVYVDGNGFVSAGMFLGGEYIVVVPWTRPSTSGRGPYLLRLVDSGRRIAAYLNNELVFDIPFEDLRLGGVSLFVGAYEEAPATWGFDDIRISEFAP